MTTRAIPVRSRLLVDVSVRRITSLRSACALLAEAGPYEGNEGKYVMIGEQATFKKTLLFVSLFHRLRRE
jgi:hypothetical protein